MKDRYEATFIVSNDTNPDSRDFTNLQDAIHALPPSGGKVFVKAGVYPLTNTIRINTSNIFIQGAGMGITQFVADAGMTGNTPALEAFNHASGTAHALLADANRGSFGVSLSPADAATFAVGQDVLLFSNHAVDTEHLDKHAGEVKRITGVDVQAGALSFSDQLFDTYTVADAASLVRLTLLRNITLADFTITSRALFSSLTVGFTHFRFVDNLTIRRLEVHDAFHSGIQLQSVLNSTIADCSIHHIKDVTPPGAVHYGIFIGGATQNLSIHGCRFAHTRHAITTGASGGLNENGVQRNIVVANCTSAEALVAHFDTHQPAENVTFTGCVAAGGAPEQGEVIGFQNRARNTVVIGCSVLQAVGKGIQLFGPVSGGAVVAGNMIANVRAVNGKEGIGIFLDSSNTSNHTITGNVIKNCEGAAMAATGANNDLVISGNIVSNTNSLVLGAAIQVKGGSRVLIVGNNLVGSTTPIQAGPDAVTVNNPGYNPVGIIDHPWAASGDLTNQVAGGSDQPKSGKTYVVRNSPKTIIISEGAGVQISVNGVNTGLTGGVFKLGIGETIAIEYTSAPTTVIYAE